MTIVRRIRIRGRVQGVGYRVWIEATAEARGVEGWVRNRRDGSVEAVIAGAQEVVQTMVALCGDGPSGARVEAIDQFDASSEELALRRAGEMFSVLPSL